MRHASANDAADQGPHAEAPRALEPHSGRRDTALHRLLNYAAVGIIRVGRDGTLQAANRAFWSMIELPPAKIPSRSIDDFLHPDDISSQRSVRGRLCDGKARVLTGEMRLVRADGANVPVRYTIAPVFERSGALCDLVSIVEDTTEQHALAEQAEKAETLHRIVLDAVPDRVCVIDCQGRIELANAAWLRAYDVDLDDVRGRTARQAFAPEVARFLEEQNSAVLSGRLPSVEYERELAQHGPDGLAELRCLLTTKVPLHDGAGEIAGLVALSRDVTERKRAANRLVTSEEQLSQLANHIPQVFWIAEGMLGRMIYVSAAAERVLGIAPEDLMRHPKRLVRSIHPQDRKRVYAQRRNAGAEAYDEIYRVVRPDGAVRWVHDRAFPVRDAGGRVCRVAGIVEDITERREAEQRLLELAHYDSLTGLANRTLLRDHMQHALAQSRRNAWMMAVMFVDIDRFKYVNDSLGHAAGDVLLKEAASRLVGCVRAEDTVARLGGDEYAIVLNRIHSAADAALVAAKIMEALNSAFRVSATEIYISASIGITIAPVDGDEPDILLRQADVAMYRAKELGRKNFKFYRPEMNARTAERLALERDLRHALDRDELVAHYQPKVRLRDRRVVGLEALMRWRHSARGVVSPADFIPMLEETGLIIPAGEQMLGRVCAQIHEWRRLGITGLPVAVNLSARQFLSPDLGSEVRHTLEAFQVEPRLLELEITESALMVDPDDAARTVQTLTELGVSVSIDDFGTGYSSLAYLKRFPLSALKIDRSFVRDVTRDADDAAITQAVTSMAHGLGLRVVAEGVETREQLAFLESCGCDEGQGYLFAKPMPAQECAAFLSAYRPGGAAP